MLVSKTVWLGAISPCLLVLFCPGIGLGRVCRAGVVESMRLKPGVRLLPYLGSKFHSSQAQEEALSHGKGEWEGNRKFMR